MIIRLATALDPRFKDLKCLPRGEREEVWKSVAALLRDEHGSTTPAHTEEPPKKRSLLLFDSDSEEEDEEESNRALNHYRAEPTIGETDCPLKWWSNHAISIQFKELYWHEKTNVYIAKAGHKNNTVKDGLHAGLDAGAHPQLSALACKYLGSPATSVPCERLFSEAGNIVTKKRAALTSDNVNRLVCLSNWMKKKKKKKKKKYA